MADSFRLTFEFRGGKFTPVGAERVQMIAPDPFGHLEGSMPPGRYVELRAAGGEVLRAVALSDDTGTVEYPTGDPEETFARVPLADGMVVSALIPADDRATEAALTEVAGGDGAAGGVELARRELAVIRLVRGDEE